MEKFTITQQNRLTELNGGPELLEREFGTKQERDSEFRRLEIDMVRENRARIDKLLQESHITAAVKNGHSPGAVAAQARDSPRWSRRR
jgi:hypothetical protein